MQQQLATNLTVSGVGDMRRGFRTAVAGLNDYSVQAIRAQSATAALTESLVKQDLTFTQAWKKRSQFNSVLREQYQLQRMLAVQWTQNSLGAVSADVIIPRGMDDRINRMTNSLRYNMSQLVRNRIGTEAFSEALGVMSLRLGIAHATMASGAENLIKWGKNTQWAGRQLMVGFTVPLAAFGALAGAAAYKVDQEMTRIQKVYDTTATSVIGKQQELDALRQSSMRTATGIAKLYGQSLKDTLEIQADLAATGQKGQELQQSSIAVTRAATLGELDRANAIKATIALQSVYGDSAEQLTKDFNYMNAIENATSLAMQDFIDAIPRGAGVMKNMGVDLREMGIILVALKQAGIGATEGMNGMRSAAQRLLMVTPKAEETWKGLLPNAPALNKIVTTYKGEFIPILQEMGKQMATLEPYQRQQIIARVFGVYQANKIYSVLDGLINKTGQVKTAYEVMNNDIADGGTKAAATAQSELDKMANSASGKFKRAVETIKAQMASVGEPFLSVAATIIGWATKLLKIFNEFPSVLKKVAAFFVIGGAILGPIIMLIGLFANLGGQVLKVSAWFVGLITKMRPMTAEQRAQQMLADRTAAAWRNQANAAQALAGQLQILTNTMTASAVAQMQTANAGMSRIAAYNQLGAVVPGIAQQNPNRYQQTANGRYRDTTTGRFVTAAEAQAYATAHQNAARASQQQAAASTTTRRNWGGIATSMGVVGLTAASFMAMQGSSSQTLNNVLNMVFAASLLGPMLVKAFRNTALTTAAQSLGAAFTGGRAAGAAAGRGGVGALASGLTAALPAAGRLLMVFMRFAGVIGAIGTVVYIFAKMYGQMNNLKKKQDEINKSSKDWADLLGFVYQEAGTVTDAHGNTVNTIDTMVTKLKEANGALVEMLQNLKKNGTEQDVINAAISEGLKVRQKGASADQAYKAVEIALRAAGYKSQEIKGLMVKVKAQVDFSDAKSTLSAQLDDFQREFNAIANNKFKQSPLEGFGRMFSGRDDINQGAAKAAEGLADQFWTSFQAKSDLQSKRGFFDQFFNSVKKEQDKAWASLGKENQKNLKEAGIEGWQEFEEALRDASALSPDDWMTKYAGRSERLRAALALLGTDGQRNAKKHAGAEEKLAQEIAKKNNMSEEDIKNIHTLNDLYGKLDMATLTLADAQKGYANATYYASLQTARMTKEEAEAYQLKILNQYRAMAGLSAATSVEQGFGDALDGTTKKLGDNANALGDAAASIDDYNNARQKAMSGAQDAAFQAADDIWNKQADAQVDAINNRGQKLEDALDARGEAADDRFDKRAKALDKRWDTIMDNNEAKWDKRIEKETAVYDNRIKKIQDTIDAEEKAEAERQRIFEAEKTRLERMAEIANKNIDFNVALNQGQLDEAAKIANDIQSTTTGYAMDDAAAASQSQSDTRKESLQKQMDSLEAQRDKRINSLKKVEEAEKKALEAKKEREKEALDAERERYQKSLDAQKKAIQEQTKRDADARRDELARMKRMLDLELQAIRANIPRNKKEYDAQIKAVEGAYNKYGVRLKGYGNDWSKMIGKYLSANVKSAANNLDNDIKWKSIGGQITNAMIDGGFGMNSKEFMKWVTTGQLPKNYAGPGKDRSKDAAIAFSNSAAVNYRHGGGPVGGSSKYQSRGGRSYGGGLHRDESFGIFKNDEYVLNGAAHKALGTGFLDSINNGKFGVGGASDPMGFAGMFAAAIAGAFTNAASLGINSAGAAASGMGVGVPGKAGKYGNMNLSAEQLRNAATIIGVGKSMGASQRDLIISIMTAMQESTLRNLNYGDRDSLGLFQQRPSQGWGTPEQITNPSYAARKFFEHLLALKGRGKLSLAGAAQAVQRSAFPDAYAKWEAMARAVVAGTGFSPFTGLGGGGIMKPLNGPVTRSWSAHPNPKGTDIGVSTGTPVRAAMGGRVITSTDLRGNQSGGYRSYGRYVVVDHGAGRKTLYAHMSNRNVVVGQNVRAGQVLGLSGNTGNSTGPHLHFETWMNGKDVKPSTFGIPGLRAGGFTLNDGLAMLHKNETVLTAPLSQKLNDGIQRIDQGTRNDYNVTVDLRGAYIRESVDIEKAVNSALDARENKLGRNRSIK